jgi:hypothetical protein
VEPVAALLVTKKPVGTGGPWWQVNTMGSTSVTRATIAWFVSEINLLETDGRAPINRIRRPKYVDPCYNNTLVACVRGGTLVGQTGIVRILEQALRAT